jgi:hypothetical protein
MSWKGRIGDIFTLRRQAKAWNRRTNPNKITIQVEAHQKAGTSET